MKKSLGQIAYEACEEGGQQNFGPWEKATPLVKRVHGEMAQAVAEEVCQRIIEGLERLKLSIEMTEGIIAELKEADFTVDEE